MKNIKQIREEHQKIDSQIVEDHEFSMARSELKSIISNAQNLLDKLKGEGDLEAWMQSKITKAADYLTAVHDNIASGEADIKEDHEEKEIKLDTKDKKIPFTIMLRRRSIRQFPNNQTVALYYAPSLDRYFSIPFGEKSGNVIAEVTRVSQKEYEQYLENIKKAKEKQQKAREPGETSIKSQHEKEVAKATADSKIETPDKSEKEKKKDTSFLGVGDEFMGHSTFGVTKLGAALGSAAGFAARPVAKAVKYAASGTGTAKAIKAVSPYVKKAFSPLEEEGILDTIKKTVDPSSPTFLAPVTSSVSGDIPKNVEQKKETLKKLRQKTVDDRKEIQRKAEAGDVEGAEKYAKENPAVIVPKEVKQSVEKATPEDVKIGRAHV